jgi:hypothetical protein
LRNQQKGPADGDFNEDEEEVLEELEDQMPNSASDMKRKKLVRKARKLDPNNPEDLERLKRR